MNVAALAAFVANPIWLGAHFHVYLLCMAHVPPLATRVQESGGNRLWAFTASFPGVTVTWYVNTLLPHVTSTTAGQGFATWLGCHHSHQVDQASITVP